MQTPKTINRGFSIMNLEELRNQMNIVLDLGYSTLDSITENISWNLECKISDLVKEIEIQTDMIDKLLKPKYEKMDGFDV